MNPTGIVDNDMAMVPKDVKDIVRQFVDAIAYRGIQVDKVLLFGSYAGNRQAADSDLNISVIPLDFGKDRLSEGILLNKLAWRVDARLHPVPFSSEAFRNDTWVPWIHEVRTKGIEIH